jgi:DNA-binding beta-propeller fold protein YncE
MILMRTVVMSAFTALATTFRATKRQLPRTVERPTNTVRTRTVIAAAIALGLLPIVLASTAGAQSYVLQTKFGSFGQGNGQFRAPLGVAIDPTTHNIVVADQSTNRVQIFDSTGVFLSTFGSFGSGNGQFNEPTGVAIDPTTHNIVVTDSSNARVEIFDSNGNYLSQFGHLSAPAGVAIDPVTHNIVVVDSVRVEIFDSTGVFLSAFGSSGQGNGEFNTPIGVAIDPTTQNIVVADAVNNNVQIFNSAGAYLGQLNDSPASYVGQLNGKFLNPTFVAIDPTTHNIVVSDALNERLQIFDSTGAYLSQFPVGGEPKGVAIDPTTHNIVVVDFTLSRIEIYAPSIVPTALDLDQHGLTGSWYQPVTNGQGLEVEVFPDQSAPGTGLTQVSWFTFATAAGLADHQRWYTMSGAVTSGQPSAALTIYQNTGGNFNALPMTTAQAVGTATLSFSSCSGGQLNYNFTDGSGRMGGILLTRLTRNVTCATTGPFPTNADFALSGNWYDAATAGQGFTVEVNPISNYLFAAWYTYAPNGAAAGVAGQRWYTAQATFTPGLRSIPVTIYETIGGIFNTAMPGGQQTLAVGTGTLAFQSCTAATFSYNFTGGSSSGLSGMINLSRVGPVPPGCM